MMDHPTIRSAEAAFDEIEDKLSKLYPLAKDAELDQKLVDNFNTQVNAWTDKYMRMFADLRNAKTAEEFMNSKVVATDLMNEGLAMQEDFRLVCLAKIQDDLAHLRARRREADEEEALEWQRHPIRSFLLYKCLFPIFECLDWILLKTRGRGLGK